MNAAEVIPLIHILAEAMRKLADIVKEDPEVWEAVKTDFLDAKKAFMEATNETDS